MRFICVVSIVGWVALIGSAAAVAQQQNVRIRGTISAFDGNVLSVQTKAGSDVSVELPDAVVVSTTKAFGMDDIKLGMVLGVTTVKRADGTVVAIDVRPIPPTATQGLSPHDLAPDSTMTNASVEGVVTAAGSQELTLNYKTGTVKALVTPATTMSQSAPGSRADLKPGETVYVLARKDEGGSLSAIRVQVSKDGINPTQ
jgi:Domain of unknown function (DUF5666)